MTFVHDDDAFYDLLRIVADASARDIALVEKDYWVTHTLWAMHAQGFEVWFKGGTSLSKGFGLIERFSEDLDLKIEPGRVAGLPEVENWKSEGTRATKARRAYFEALHGLLDVPGTSVTLDDQHADATHRSANLQINFPNEYQSGDGLLRPFVLLEVGHARVTPFVHRDMTSLVHDHLESAQELGKFIDNRPRAVRCVHPIVTLIEKLDALMKRVSRPDVEPATFVRHFEDAARIAASKGLPPLPEYSSVLALANSMKLDNQILSMPVSVHEAFNPNDAERWRAVRRALEAIAPMFWGERIPLEQCCEEIRGWIDSELT